MDSVSSHIHPKYITYTAYLSHIRPIHIRYSNAVSFSIVCVCVVYANTSTHELMTDLVAVDDGAGGALDVVVVHGEGIGVDAHRREDVQNSQLSVPVLLVHLPRRAGL